MIRTALMGAVAALVLSGMAAAQVTQTGDVRLSNGQEIQLQTFTLYEQTCNGGLGGIVGQGTCTLATSGGGGGGSIGTQGAPDIVGGSQGTPFSQDTSNRIILPPIVAGTASIGGSVNEFGSRTSPTVVSSAAGLPVQPNGPAYTLTSTAQAIAAGYYYLNLPGAFNGATGTLTATSSNGATTTTTYTSAPATPPGFAIAAGTTASVAYTGGTPTGATTLAGGPPATVASTVTTITPSGAAMAAIPTPSSSTNGVALASGASGTELDLGTSAQSVSFTTEASATCGSAAPAFGGITLTGPAIVKMTLTAGQVVCVFAVAGVAGYRAF